MFFSLISSFLILPIVLYKESFIISPLLIVIILSEYFSTNSILCVTTITNLSKDIFLSISKIIMLFSLSKEAVGSSAIIIFESFINALAILILCFSPADKFLHFLSS